MLHGADELALEEVQPLERALFDGRERRERAVDHPCVHPGPQRPAPGRKWTRKREKKAAGDELCRTPKRNTNCYAPHTSRA